MSSYVIFNDLRSPENRCLTTYPFFKSQATNKQVFKYIRCLFLVGQCATLSAVLVIENNRMSSVATTKSKWSADSPLIGLKPLIIWMRLIGIIPFYSSSASLFNLYYLYVVGAWLFTILVHCIMLFVFFYCDNYTFFATTGKSNFEKATFSWIRIINHATNAVHSCGIHSILLFIVMFKNRWKELQESLKQTESRFRLPTMSQMRYRRKCCIAGIIYTFVSVSFITLI